MDIKAIRIMPRTRMCKGKGSRMRLGEWGRVWAKRVFLGYFVPWQQWLPTGRHGLCVARVITLPCAVCARAPNRIADLCLRALLTQAMLMALHDLGISQVFDVVYGASAGAINATYFLTGQRNG